MTTQETFEFNNNSKDSTSPFPDMPLNLQNIYSIGYGSSNASSFFPFIKKHGITCILDTRENTFYRSHYFSGNKNDISYIAGLLGIEYIHIPGFAPDKEQRDILAEIFKDKKSSTDDERSKVWSNYLFAVYKKISDKQVLKSHEVQNLIYGNHTAIGICCSCSHHLDCHRQVVYGLLKHYLPNVNTEIIYDGKEPKRAYPRRIMKSRLMKAEIYPEEG